MLADRVERAVLPPGVEHVPGVGPLIGGENGRGDSTDVPGAPSVGPARDRLVREAPLDPQEVIADG